MRLSRPVLLVARALLDRPDEKHWGHALIRQTGLRPGTIYPMLARMLAAGWLVDRGEESSGTPGTSRRCYTVSTLGKEELARLAAQASTDSRFAVAGRLNTARLPRGPAGARLAGKAEPPSAP